MAIDWNKYIGLPFKNCGRGPGYDCWGIVWLLHREINGIEIPSYDDAYFSTRDAVLPELFARERQKWIRTDQPDVGDVALFNICGRPRHVGFVTDPAQGRMIHTLYGCASISEHYMSKLWRNRIAGFFRHHTRHG